MNLNKILEPLLETYEEHGNLPCFIFIYDTEQEHHQYVMLSEIYVSKNKNGEKGLVFKGRL